MASQAPILTDLPRELRDKTYQDILKDTNPVLRITKDTDTSNPHFLTTQLPPSLQTNKQIVEEATLAYLRGVHIVDETPNLTTLYKLLDNIPEAWQNVRSLEFTSPIDRYAMREGEEEDGERGEGVRFVGNIVSRCSGLQELTLTVNGSMFLAIDANVDVQAARSIFSNTATPHKLMVESFESFDAHTGVSRIFENTKLAKLNIMCKDGVRYGRMGIELRKVLVKFADMFEKEKIERKWRATFNVLLEPSFSYDEKSYELSWWTEGYVKSYFYQDFFG